MDPQHVTIYREPGRYAGWPANYGIWSWGDEIVVGFTVGYHDLQGGFHTRDRTRPFKTMQARSLDGGQTWAVAETPCRIPGGRALSADEHLDPAHRVSEVVDDPHQLADCPGVDFADPDFSLMCARTGLAHGARSWFYTSTDRCRNWDGPYALPDFGLRGIAARTDYLVSDGPECTLFLTAAKGDGREGRPFCARSHDRGASFQFRSWIGPEPPGFGIMPASVRLLGGRVLVAVRVRGGGERGGNWIDLHASDDDCQSWRLLGKPAANTGPGGNPPTLARLRDGRLCVTYGFRDAPYQMRARVSDDDGATWSEERVLRDRGGVGDLGYPRTVQRADGAVVTVYYFNDTPESERYVAATIWRP